MIVDLFAGPGGWDLGARWAGLPDPIGIEWGKAECATRAHHRMPTIRADLATYQLPTRTRIDGLIASPPCTDFSSAGRRAGRNGTSGHLVDIPLAWVHRHRPRWCAWEQVPEVLPIWHEHAHALGELGYSAWCGVLCAADYGVPQTRRRAILVAHRDRPVAPPEPSHARHPVLFGSQRPWVAMGEALGPDLLLVLARNGASAHWVLAERQTHGARRALGQPAMTITASADNGNFRWVREWPATTIRLTIPQALTLQSFPADHHLAGNKTEQWRQVGNAIPPLLAAAVLQAVAS